MGIILPTIGAIITGVAAGFSLTAIIVGALVSTAVSVLGQLIMAPRKRGGDPFTPTAFTQREVGGTTPLVVGCRRGYGIDVYRKNESSTLGASSLQFYQIIYSVGPIGFLENIQVIGERNIFSLGNANAKSAVVDFRYGTLDQTPTGHGWADIAGTKANTKNKYDALGLMLTPDSPHPVAYIGRAGINLVLAADEQGRNAGMTLAADAMISGLLCRRFKNADGDTAVRGNSIVSSERARLSLNRWLSSRADLRFAW